MNQMKGCTRYKLRNQASIRKMCPQSQRTIGPSDLQNAVTLNQNSIHLRDMAISHTLQTSSKTGLIVSLCIQRPLLSTPSTTHLLSTILVTLANWPNI